MSAEQTVLIVDNHETEATRLARQLAYVGLKTTFTTTGEGAMRQIAEHCPALVLLEVELSDMDGLEVVSFIRNTAKIRDIPILAMSAFPHMRDRCLQGGCDHFIPKPLRLVEVVNLIKRCLP
jgi:CheY-like chemotaxis protein